MSKYKLGKTSLKRLTGVDKRLVEIVKKAIEETNQDFSVVEGLRSVERQNELFKKGYTELDGYSLKSAHQCVSEDMEILTTYGWKKIDDEIKKDEKVITVNPINFKIEEKEIKEVIKFDFNGIAYHIKNSKIDLLTTDNHRHFVYIDIYNKNLKPIFMVSKKIFEIGTRKYFIRAGSPTKYDNELSYIEKLAIATVCDGSFSFKKNTKSTNISFYLGKQRKIEYLIKLLEENNEKYSLKPEKNRPYIFYLKLNAKLSQKILNLIGKNKSLEYFIKNKKENAKQIIDIYTFFDGTIPKNQKSSIWYITSINKKNIDLLSVLGVYAGYTVYNSERSNINSTFPSNKIIYTVTFGIKRFSRADRKNFKIVKYNGRFWSLNNENTTLIVRRNGKVIVTGNSGKAVDIAPYKNGKLLWDFKGNEAEWLEVGRAMLRSARILGYNLEWGITYNLPKGIDLPHFQLK